MGHPASQLHRLKYILEQNVLAGKLAGGLPQQRLTLSAMSSTTSEPERGKTGKAESECNSRQNMRTLGIRLSIHWCHCRIRSGVTFLLSRPLSVRLDNSLRNFFFPSCSELHCFPRSSFQLSHDFASSIPIELMRFHRAEMLSRLEPFSRRPRKIQRRPRPARR